MIAYTDNELSRATIDEIRSAYDDAHTLQMKLQGAYCVTVLARKRATGDDVRNVIALFNDTADAPAWIADPLFTVLETIGDVSADPDLSERMRRIDAPMETIYNLLAERRNAYTAEAMRRGQWIEAATQSKYLF